MYLGLVLVGSTHAQSQVADLSKLTQARKCELSAELSNEGYRRFLGLGYKGGLNYLPTSVENAFDDDDLSVFFRLKVLVAFSGNQPKYTFEIETLRDFQSYSETDEFGLSESLIKLAKAYSYRTAADGTNSPRPLVASVVSDEDEFAVSVQFSESSARRAKDFADAYTYFIEEGLCLYDANPPDVTRLLAENTTVSTSREQVLIRTRLPRSALDSLLAKDAK